MKIAVVGATSFIGLELLRSLAKESNVELLAVARQTSPKIKEILKIGNNIKLKYLTLEEYEHLGTVIGPVDCLVYLTWNGTRGTSRVMTMNYSLLIMNRE